MRATSSAESGRAGSRSRLGPAEHPTGSAGGADGGETREETGAGQAGSGAARGGGEATPALCKAVAKENFLHRRACARFREGSVFPKCLEANRKLLQETGGKQTHARPREKSRAGKAEKEPSPPG